MLCRSASALALPMSPIPTLARISLVLSTAALLLAVLLQQHFQRLTKDVDDAVSGMIRLCLYCPNHHPVLLLRRPTWQHGTPGNRFQLTSRSIHLESHSLRCSSILHLVLQHSLQLRHRFCNPFSSYRPQHLENPQPFSQPFVHSDHHTDTPSHLFSSRRKS